MQEIAFGEIKVGVMGKVPSSTEINEHFRRDSQALRWGTNVSWKEVR